MFNTGDVVIIKDLKTLLKEKHLFKAEDLQDVYVNSDKKYVLFSDFIYFGSECTIDSIDVNDPDIPYFLSIGIWVPEFMIMNKLQPKNDVQENKKVADLKVENEPALDNKEKQLINQHNGKPFGTLFLKLIKLDPKIAEFSSTTFSKLKKHELLYIANILHGKNLIDDNYNKLLQRELVSVCYNAAKKL